jgi:chromosome segregation ATPase
MSSVNNSPWSIRIPQELKDKMTDYIKQSGLSHKDFFEQLVQNYQVKSIKNIPPVFSSDIDELQTITSRINSIFANMCEKTETFNNQQRTQFQETVSKKDEVIARQMEKISELELQLDSLFDNVDKLKSNNQDLSVRIESLTQAVDSDKKLIDEYTAKIKTLEKELDGHEKLKSKVFELEENLLKERQKNNQANIKLENEKASVSELTKQIKILERNHEKALKQKTEELLVSKDQKVLEVRMECQDQLEKMQENYTKKMSALLSKIEKLQ